ncbi:MAG: metallophosphoesterase family protein [Candidatus Woesearchaeota archaeon]
MKILVLSDTHLKNDISELPEEVINEIYNSDYLLHAGDFKTLNFYKSLKDTINIKAVYGNMDRNNLKEVLNEKEIYEVNGYKIALIHGHQLNNISIDSLSYTFPDADLIIFGHTHKPFNEEIEGQIIFNPGSAVQKRLQKHFSYGIININKGITTKIINF